MSTYIPPGWPAGVHPPGSEEFESTAVGWLLDVVPPDYRLHGVLRRYPIALAVMARHHSKACVEGAREGYRTARTELAGVLPRMRSTPSWPPTARRAPGSPRPPAPLTWWS